MKLILAALLAQSRGLIVLTTFYCLGLNFRDWFLTPDKCQKLLCHWSNRADWLDTNEADRTQSRSDVAQSELWHGSRFRELSWFWDPTKEYTLPELCPHCNRTVPAALLEQVRHSMNCPHCSSTFAVQPRKVCGDPRNQAIIIHEDGWCPFSTSSGNSIAAITITHACMSKIDRADVQNARVYSFIPVSQLPTDTPHKFDAFFEPLIREIEELYIEGEEVYFSAPVPGFTTGDSFATLRALPLLITADSKARHEIGLTSAGGVRGCRRCKVEGKYIPERRPYYYGNFHQRYWRPCARRSVVEERANGKRVDAASSTSERRRIAKETGVTGESIFFRFHDLCEFDPIQDIVIDAMHAISLNLIRTELLQHLLADLGENASLPPLDRDPRKRGLMNREDLAEALSKVEWTTELRDGQIPSVDKQQGLSKLPYWKAEEYSKFILVAPVVLRTLIPKNAYHCFMLLRKIYTLVFSRRLRIQGWTKDHSKCFTKLVWAHAIKNEELYGLGACSENVEYCLHMAEDIERHSLMDNYWCYLYECLVKYYKQQSSNMKNLCKTFADRAAQLQFVNTHLTSIAVAVSPTSSTKSRQFESD